jgi:hypothetical protein
MAHDLFERVREQTRMVDRDAPLLDAMPLLDAATSSTSSIESATGRF